MKKLNTRTKLLSMALMGLGGLALAGGAAAQSTCPSSPVAWTSASTLLDAHMSIEAGGLGGTNCRLDVWVGSGAQAVSSATVYDASPNNEPRYRVQFILDLDNLPSPTLTTGAQIFTTETASGKSLQLTVSGIGGDWYVTYFVPDANSPTGVASGTAKLAPGENTVEFDLNIASGTFDLWVNNNDAGNPTVAESGLDISAMGGVDGAYLGVAGATNDFIGTFASAHIELDQFDSRRTTFIGF